MVQNLCDFFHCTITNTYAISRAIMTGISYRLKYLLIWLLILELKFLLLISRVISLSLCSRNESFLSGSLDRTVLLWDQRAEKCQVWIYQTGSHFQMVVFSCIILFLFLGPSAGPRKTSYNIWWSRSYLCHCFWWMCKNVWFPQIWKG